MDIDLAEKQAHLQAVQVLGEIMRQIRDCDEKLDDDGYCKCSRYIEYWLFLFKRNELLAAQLLEAKSK